MIAIDVYPERVLGTISRYLTGACLEDVNHEVYGGIYSQMIFGESFEEEPMDIRPDLTPAFEGLEGTVSCLAEREHLRTSSEIRSWQPFRRGTARGRFKATQLRARRGVRSQRIEFAGGDGEVGIENRGLNRWGMHVVAGRRYEGTLVAAAEMPDRDPDATVAVHLRLALVTDTADTVAFGETVVHVPADGQWHVLSYAIDTTGGTDSGEIAQFEVLLSAPATVWVDYVRLEPGPWGRFHGLPVRRDIGEALVDQGLTLLRYGGYMINTDWAHEQQVPGSGYRWKKMIGPRHDRPPYRGTFYRYNSNGFGIIDYIAFCEAAGFVCVPTLNPMETIQDLRDFVEYVNGQVDTPWGALRARDGHPAPFGLRYIQIGNEEHARRGPGLPPLVDLAYAARIRSTVTALHEKDPAIVPILGAGLWANGDGSLRDPQNVGRIRKVVEAVRGFEVLWDVHVNGDDLMDAHDAAEGISLIRRVIDEADPDNRIGLCVLEENGGRHDLQRALGHVHNIMTFERLRLVVLDSAANCLQPWQQNDNAWDQGQLFFTQSQVWGMPPYYAQQMLSRAYQPFLVESEASDARAMLDVVATRSETGDVVVLKILNLGSEPVGCTLKLQGREPVAGEVSVTTLTGPLDAENTPEAPERIVPEERVVAWDGGDLEHVFAGYSFTVLRLASNA